MTSGAILQMPLLEYQNKKEYPWKLHLIFNKIQVLSSGLNVTFPHDLRSVTLGGFYLGMHMGIDYSII